MRAILREIHSRDRSNLPPPKANQAGKERGIIIKNEPTDHLPDPERFVTSATYVINLAQSEQEPEKLVGYRLVLRREAAGDADGYRPAFVITDHPTHPQAGVGVFAMRPFECRAFLMPYQGISRVTEAEQIQADDHNTISCPRRTWWEASLGLNGQHDKEWFKQHHLIRFTPRPAHHAAFSASFEYCNHFNNIGAKPTAMQDGFGGVYAMQDIKPAQEVLLDYYGDLHVAAEETSGRRARHKDKEEKAEKWEHLNAMSRVDTGIKVSFKKNPRKNE